MIERNEFLKMCQRAAMLPKGSSVPDELRVIFMGVEWKPAYYAMKFDSDGNAINVACLKDINANCIDYALLNEIEAKIK